MLGHFGDVHPSQSHVIVLKKLNPTQHKQATPGIERVQALTDISHSVLCCHSNKTRAPIANPHNSAQQEGTLYHSPNLHPGPCSSVGMRRGTNTQTAVTNIHFALATPHVKCNRNKIVKVGPEKIHKS